MRIRVSPPEAYIFVDGQPFAHRSQTITLPTGEHTIGVYNYGFVPQVQTVRLEPGKNPEMVMHLEATPGMVSGPWGRIQIEGNANDSAAVFINGVKPEYFVGHVDEMNHEILATQKLILPVGTYELILVNPKETEPFFTDKIEVLADQRLVVNVAKKTHTYYNWTKAGHHTSRERFQTGPNTASIAVAPVTGNFTVDKDAIKCGETVQLSWTSTEAADISIASSPSQAVPATGQRTESPTQTTIYTFLAKGPGGVVTRTATVHVDPTVQTALTASPKEVHYRRIDDKVINPGTSTLTWSAENAQFASITPLGTVPTNGQKGVAVAPQKTDVGTVDEMATYVLMASNNCGGSDKSLAAVHITGTIEPLPMVKLLSVFFPTAYPTEKNPEIGLLNNQKERLEEAVAGYKKFLEYDPDTKLKIIGNADPRSTDEFNMALSERRGQIVKDALIALGVDAAKIEIQPLGETQQLDKAAVKALEESHGLNRPATTELVLAYNRRVDLVMIPTQKPEQKSEVMLPKDRLLQSSTFKSLRTIEKASALAGGVVAAGQQ
ncbi:MAG: OmpA family protein [Acidobacteriia bacterium]|nr:OmpA family protein [Terriglobia bacterium]